MKYCLHCGCIYAESYINYENQSCMVCGFRLIEDTSMTEEQFLQLSESEKDTYELKIYNICKKSDFFDENDYNEVHSDLQDWYYTFRFDKYEQLSGKKAYTKENELYYDMQSHKRVNEAMAKYAGTIGSSNVPKCPTCGSTRVSKISTTSKVAGAVAFGLFSKTAKSQFKCVNCGYKW